MQRFVLITLFLALFACKPVGRESGGGEIKSLDNLAKDGEVSKNSCDRKSASFSYEQYASSIRSGSQEAALKKSLGAVPSRLRDYFFKDMQGQLVVDSALAARHCAVTDAAASQFASEFGDAPFNVCLNGRTIYVDNKKDAVAHSLVRLFSYVFSEQILGAQQQLATSSNEHAAAFEASAKIERDYMATLASTFINEISSRKDLYSAADRLQRFQTNAPQQLAAFVFADAMDSYYCSAKTKANFRSMFPQTFAIFSNDFQASAAGKAVAATSYAKRFE